jgi:hypothetical protein
MRCFTDALHRQSIATNMLQYYKGSRENREAIFSAAVSCATLTTADNPGAIRWGNTPTSNRKLALPILINTNVCVAESINAPTEVWVDFGENLAGGFIMWVVKEKYKE